MSIIELLRNVQLLSFIKEYFPFIAIGIIVLVMFQCCYAIEVIERKSILH